MQLYVQVVEARNLIAKDPNGFSDPFVRLALGATKSRTVVVHKNLNPSWHEEFFFNVSDLDDELKVTVWDQDRFSDDFLGQMKIPVSQVLNADKQTLSNKWFPLQKRSEKSKNDVSGMNSVSSDQLMHVHLERILEFYGGSSEACPDWFVS